MMKKFSLLCFIIPIVSASAQNIDSLYNEIVRINGLSQLNNQQSVSIQNEPSKCFFGILNQVKQNFNRFSVQQQKTLNSIFQRPSADTSIVTPKGWFRIHFNKNEFPDYVPNDIRNNLTSDQLLALKKTYLDSLAIAADSAYTYEVNILGYPPPPEDAFKGGDNRYDVYLISNGGYGGTWWEDTLSTTSLTSYIQMDNAFGSGFYTQRINAAKVTITHEFHHAIQLGNYGYRASDNFYYELTSTSMEEFVYPSVDDYIQYISYYLRNPQQTFNNIKNSYNGYDLAVWNIFLKDRFGCNIIKRIWELIPGERALIAIDDAIKENGSSFEIEFNTFGIWIYFTGVRAISNKYFTEAGKYPLISPMLITNSVLVNSEPVSLNYFQFETATQTTKDSIVTLVSNCDVNSAVESSDPVLPFTYTLSNQQISGGKKIAEGFYSKLESGNLSFLLESNVLSGNMPTEETVYAYPQPFRYSAHNELFIPINGIKGETANLSVFSVDMRLVYRGFIKISTDQVISWDVSNQTGKKLSTGVYLYITKFGDTIKKGKFVVYND